ncbi:MAG TPA: hypothetical protein ENJ95_02865 [Bacteroidetes bacterium]|nr:hypothetical protein [Bacteroidota bacterium]
MLFIFGFIPAPKAFPDTLGIADSLTIFEHLQQDSHLNIVLQSDFKNLVKNKRKNDYQPATMKVSRADGSEETWAVDIRPRGNMRRTVCDIPPLKMRFSEQQLSARGLDDRSTLKMVISCRNGEGFEQMVLREYMAYRMYNLISDCSFRVQLAKVKFVDENGEKSFDESFAFFIEHAKNLADRSGLKVVGSNHVKARFFDNDAGEVFAMFQFMIGNTDWFYCNSHNVEICGKKGVHKLVPIPYDFDYAGFVKTPYAVPLDKLKLSTVGERYYQGFCRTEEETMQTVQLFLDNKDAILKAVNEFPYFSKHSIKYSRKYIRSFFEILENPKARKKYILKHCGMWPVP